MRDQGRLTDWDDGKGFGFVTPDKGGLRAFVHIRAFSSRHRRPRNGDVITYQLAWDPQGRPRAENVLFRELPKATAEPKATGLIPAVLLVITFIGSIIALVVDGKIPWFVPVVYFVTSLLTFTVYAFDKSAAMNRRWRTSEQSLQFLSLFGGWPGALIAQRLFHHKSRKLGFQTLFWLIVAIHVAAAAAFAAGYFRMVTTTHGIEYHGP